MFPTIERKAFILYMCAVCIKALKIDSECLVDYRPDLGKMTRRGDGIWSSEKVYEYDETDLIPVSAQTNFHKALLHYSE